MAIAQQIEIRYRDLLYDAVYWQEDAHQVTSRLVGFILSSGYTAKRLVVTVHGSEITYIETII